MFARIVCMLLLLGLAVPVFADPVAVGSDATPTATAASSTPDAGPQLSDASAIEKLWKDGSFIGVAIMVLYVGLFAAGKLDKKHAFYWATALGGVGVLVESIRRGDAPGAGMTLHTLGPTVGLLIAGPNHIKADASSSSN